MKSHKMEYRSSVLTFLYFLALPVHLLSPDTHSLQYLYTANRRGIAVGLVDEEEFVYFDSTTRKMILKTEWIQKINVIGHEYWNNVAARMQLQQDRLHDTETKVKQSFNHSEAGHVLQLMYSCQLYDDTPTTSYMKFGYNGEDFFHLDLKTRSWTPDKLQAESIIKDWDPKGHQANYWKDQLETDCIDWLKKYMYYSKGRKVRPEVSLFQNHSSSPEVVCHATDFFPKNLNISWQKDREDLYEDVELGQTLPNQDGSFQKRSILKVSAEELQNHKYTCVIQHSSLEEDLVLCVNERRILRGEGPERRSDGEQGGLSVGVVIVGVVVALIVLIAVVAGIVFWKKKKSDYRAAHREEECGL